MPDQKVKRFAAKKPRAAKRRPQAKPRKRAGLYELAWIQFRALRWL
jgi:hypothetical protein